MARKPWSLTDEERREIGILRLAHLRGEPNTPDLVALTGIFDVTNKTVRRALLSVLKELPADLRPKSLRRRSTILEPKMQALFDSNITNERIAEVVGLSVMTVRRYRREIYPETMRRAVSEHSKRREAVERRIRAGEAPAAIARSVHLTRRRVEQIRAEIGVAAPKMVVAAERRAYVLGRLSAGARARDVAASAGITLQRVIEIRSEARVAAQRAAVTAKADAVFVKPRTARAMLRRSLAERLGGVAA